MGRDGSSRLGDVADIMEGGTGVQKGVGNDWEQSIDVGEGDGRGENGSHGLRSRSEGSGR